MTSSGRTSLRAAGEEEKRCATDATAQVTLPGSAQTLMRATEGAAEVEEGRASLCATAATGLVTLQGSALREMAVEMLGVQSATDVTGLATLLGSALRVMVDVTLAGVVMEEIQGVSEVDAISAVGVVDPSATSATGLATLPGSAEKRRIAATSVTGLGTLRGTAARTRTPATTAMRWVTS